MLTHSVPAACLLLLLAASLPLCAQDSARPDAALLETVLPDAPAASASYAADQPPSPGRPFAKFILPGTTAPRLGVRGKILFGIKDSASIGSGVAWIVNAGFVQATDGKPHYGTDSGAFAARFGAAALRDTTEDIISESILAPIVRQDPRYYIMGKDHNPLQRIFYAASRTLITRRDDGRNTVNLWLLGGDFAGAALTNTYYPHRDGGVTNTFEIFAGSVGGSALDFIFSEFFSGVYDLLHLKSASQ